MNPTNPQSPEPPLGIFLFAVGIIISSLGQITALDFQHYCYTFQDLPVWLIGIRYSVSWGLRIVGLTAGIGILFQKEFGRKVGLALGAFTILTIYWKHPYIGFYHHVQYLQSTLFFSIELSGVTGLSLPQLARVSSLTASFADVIFAAFFLFYFTRPKIKKYFR